MCLVLLYGTLVFIQDSNELVLIPIENMMEKVRRIAKNPLEAAQIEENEDVMNNMMQQVLNYYLGRKQF